ncbi:tyrosine-type recombinase/integrase [Planctopirus hydrillae]|uniref:Core-binding (CB) domain-containing protein n=1 Tax=Planctopirus hydrillae TaxID=1841610 RepID=A0A1C3EIT9_9PLAN|nr:site-specific integrase [Planctopirus hydrillae]ODA33129.1 hypothetical protein A6X21_05025 [Planctopirus hydrillae]
MASLSKDASGNITLQVVCSDGRRRPIRLGKTPIKAARSFKLRLEALVACQRSGSPWPTDLAAWVGTLPDDVHEKLSRPGLELVPRREPVTIATLGGFLDKFMEKQRSLVKGGTLVFIGHGVRNLRKCFGNEVALAEITPGMADDFQGFLRREKLSPATIDRRLSLARSIFRSAVRHKLIEENPFEGLRASNKTNPARQRFIDRTTIERVIAACPDAEWRLLVSLARFGGLRIPSEAVGLRWSDIDWERDRIRISSPKTEHHVGHESREIPLFPELLPPLMERQELAEDGTEFVFERLRRDAAKSDTGWKSVNLRTQFTRIIRKAGLTPWPRLWVNLRASCSTELAERFPGHVVAGWLGHSETIAVDHYRQTLDSHFESASKSSLEPTRKVVQKAVQSGAIRTLPEVADHCPENDRTPQNKLFCGALMLTDKAGSVRKMVDTGFEPVTSTV